MFLGLRTVVYPAPDLAAAKEWWSGVLGIQPYFDEPFFVGFNPGGYELGLDPAADPALGARSYWGVRDFAATEATLLAAGAVVVEPGGDVGDGIVLGTFRTPDGSLLGIIQNPVFGLTDAGAPESDGPGR
ncbi:VOC family protein [Leifsonia poae]|uniref:VOC family protein n=1 Tax=Leifsonia poae TaxID=110933 RepID=UPI003D66DBC3